MKDKRKNKMYMKGKLIRFIFICFSLAFFLFPVSCGYQIVGSKPLPFQSVTIHPVLNKTYEPKLEEKLHNSLSKEFIAQGIKVMAYNGDIDLTATITTFQLGAIAHIDEKIQEQEITLKVDIRIIDRDRIIEFKSMQSPIKITFQTTGTVSESVSQKEKAIDKACSEIAREIISKIIIRYAA
jgi:uncharacterized lipoprotein YajG